VLNLIGQQRQYGIGSFDMRSGRECRHAAPERSRRPKVTKAGKARPELKSMVANEPKTVVAKPVTHVADQAREARAAEARFAPHEHGHMHAGAQMHVGPSATGEDLWYLTC
jgi:hypothetical protein